MPLLTPQFDLSQSEDHIIIKLKLPYVKISKSEFLVLRHEFHFFVKPYSLKLTFEIALKEQDEPDKLAYDPNDFTLTCFLLKANKGEHCQDLHMITQLLHQRRKKQETKKQQLRQGPKIQVVSETTTNEEQKEQPNVQTVESLMSLHKYGFNNQYENVFDDLEEELYEIGILNPQVTPVEARLALLKLQLKEDFDADHYLYDFYENEEIDEVLQCDLHTLTEGAFTYNNDEIKILEQLPNKDMLVVDVHTIHRQLIDVLFAILYEMRAMRGELLCESAATINKLSATLSAFACEDTPKKVLITCYQRALCYPLLRSFELAELTQQDLVTLIEEGKPSLIKLMIKLKQYHVVMHTTRLFKSSEPRYILNLLYIDDMLYYLQTPQFNIHELAALLHDQVISQEDLDLNLLTLQKQAFTEQIE